MFHNIDIKTAIKSIETTEKGLSSKEAGNRLDRYGLNVLPEKPPHSILNIFVQQFLNPLIFTLCVATVISLLIGDFKDAIFIMIVILINAIIGTVQEYSAERSAYALKQLSSSITRVLRDGELTELESEKLVQGDIILLESGDRVPADIRLIETKNVKTDESLLTGESLTVSKNHDLIFEEHTALGDRLNMAFAGSTITSGRAKGIVVNTGNKTELGKIANALAESETAKPPLLIRMEDFTKKISILLVVVTIFMAGYLILRGHVWQEVFIFTVAVAVAAIPEGLPVSMTVALSIASRKMAKRNVIVRKLPAVEALGSCTYIATDKTGTLTVNQLTIQQLAFPQVGYLSISGSGLNPEGQIYKDHIQHKKFDHNLLAPLIRSGVLCNEAKLKNHQADGWKGHGDAVDLALLTLAHKAQIEPDSINNEHPQLQYVPYESENQYAASLNVSKDGNLISIKGALEKVLPLCSSMTGLDGPLPVNRGEIQEQADHLAEQGFKVLALAMKKHGDGNIPLESQLKDLIFLGLIGMLDPLRPEAKESIERCKHAGIKVAMITGDHPKTSLAIARQIGLASSPAEVVTGPQLKTSSDAEHRKLILNSSVFARVDPQQKLEIVDTLIKNKEFIAVTGDGANDAPALNIANVGIAMGKSGTDVAKETADLIITDDRFASIIAGIEEGRIAYSNIRKVIYLLISTGMAELVLFILSLGFDTPMPLTAIQILWLNLVTNGIQDKGLAFEPGEGDELDRNPRDPGESIFDHLMIERITLSSLVMGVLSFAYFIHLMDQKVNLDEARNLVLLLMVLFENFMIANCRSENKSAFATNIMRNPILLIGIFVAQLIHISSMYIPALREVLGTRPVGPDNWLTLLVLASSVIWVMEIHKWGRRKTQKLKKRKNEFRAIKG